MGWRIDPVGFGVLLQPTVPVFVEKNLPQAANAFLASAGLGPGDVARYVCHPGGAKVVPAMPKLARCQPCPWSPHFVCANDVHGKA